MILLDVNVLIYAYDVNYVKHLQIKLWFEEKISSNEFVYFSWQTITAFLRISTNQRLFPNPLTEDKAAEKVQEWLTRPNARILVETERHWAIFKEIILQNNLRAAKIMDAHLAALAIEHGATLATTDRDFANFKGLKILNPLD